jgi:hypothetical protein
MKGSKTMKLATGLFMTCLIIAVTMPALAQNGQGFGNGGQKGAADCLGATTVASVQDLSAIEEEDILKIREEEKLALDVYRVLYAEWNLRIFDNIAASEQRHFDAIGKLIRRYGLEDPAQAAGVFTNQDLQALYDELVAQGKMSVLEALQVGVRIEMLDIADLETALQNTAKKDIERVYTNLQNGSYSHLDAFESHIEAIGAY